MTVQGLFGLSKPPVAIGFLSEPPTGLERWSRDPVPAGCAFWKEAQHGRAFYTLREDHCNPAPG